MRGGLASLSFPLRIGGLCFNLIELVEGYQPADFHSALNPSISIRVPGDSCPRSYVERDRVVTVFESGRIIGKVGSADNWNLWQVALGNSIVGRNVPGRIPVLKEEGGHQEKAAPGEG